MLYILSIREKENNKKRHLLNCIIRNSFRIPTILILTLILTLNLIPNPNPNPYLNPNPNPNPNPNKMVGYSKR